MVVPSNLIKKNYTAGKEFVYSSTQKEYQGHYYELNGKYFVGKDFNIYAAELVKKNSSGINPLLLNPSTYLYGALSKLTPIGNNPPSSFFYNYNSDSDIRYFLLKFNVTPRLIKEVNKQTFDEYKSNPLYLSVSLSYSGGFNPSELDEAEKKISGIKDFVLTSYTKPPIEESGLDG
jgi:hypothetical protein